MASVTGTRLTLTDTVGLAVDMSPTIQLIDPFDVGVLSHVGLSSLDKECVETKHSWMEDNLRPLTSTITDNPLSNVATTINVNTGDGVLFRKGDVVLIDSELIRLSADPSTDALTTVASPNGRGFGGSTAASHSQNAAIEIVSITWAEGESTPGLARTTTKSQVDNYTQIFETTIQVSSTLEAVEQWAPGSEYARSLAKEMKTLYILLDKTLIYGKPAARSSNNSNTGALGGIRHFVTTNVTAASGAQLSEKLVQDMLQQGYDAGGKIDSLLLTMTQKRALNKFLDANRRTGMEDRQAGAIVDSYLWEQGVIDVVMDRWLPKDEVIGITSEYIGFGPLRGQAIAHEILPKLSRTLPYRGEVTGEYTAEVKSQKAHARITGLATTIV